MADQLLSQSDVDALIASLTQGGDITVAAPKVEEPNNAIKPADNKAQDINKPVAAKDSNNTPVTKPSPVVENKITAPAPKPVSDKPVQNYMAAASVGKVENKADKNADMLNVNLDEKIDELTRKMEQFSSLSKKVDLIEKRLLALENTVNKNQGKADIENKVNSMVEEIKKINIGLKGTPGYAVKHKFTCEKCEDHGHVAIKYRCTKCGQEKWYGWWPNK